MNRLQPVTQNCVHVHANPFQASCVIPDESERSSVRVCMSCAMAKIEEWIQAGDVLQSIPPRVTFRGCVHKPKNGKCSVCYTSFIGLLFALWGHHVSLRKWRQDDPIADLIRVFRIQRGPWRFGTDPSLT